MTTADIAQVVSDVVNKRFRVQEKLRKTPQMVAIATGLIMDPKIVNATAIYEGIRDSTKEQILLYEDHPCIAPPWEEFIVAYENQHGNVIVMHANAQEYRRATREIPWQSTADTHQIDWSRVRWIINTFVYAGGYSKLAHEHKMTTGPLYLWRYAIYEDGSPADLYWMNFWDDDADSLKKRGMDFANFVMMGALNFLNCRNVQIVEMQHPNRAERRRVEKFGVTINEINIYPVGKRATYTKPAEPGKGVPLTAVRGYFATYTEERPLFGKYPGRFWIPQHARGKKELGERRNTIRLRTGPSYKATVPTRPEPRGSSMG